MFQKKKTSSRQISKLTVKSHFDNVMYSMNIYVLCLSIIAICFGYCRFMDDYRFPKTIDDSSCSFVRGRANEEFIVDIEECLKLQTKEEKVWN